METPWLGPLHPKPQAPPPLGAGLMAPHGQMFTHLPYLSLPLAAGHVPQPRSGHWEQKSSRPALSARRGLPD